MGFVIEPPVTASQDALPFVHSIGESETRLEIVLVNRIVVRIGEQRVVGLPDRNDFKIVAESEAQGELAIELPLVLQESGVILGFVKAAARPRDADREPIGVGSRIGRIESRVALAK